MEKQDPADDKKKSWADDFVAVEQEIKKWKKEVTEDQTHTDPKPTRTFTCIGVDFADGIPKGFLRNVGTVDKKVLREADVSPKDGESQ